MAPHCQQDKELHPQPGHKAAPAQPGLSAGCVAPQTHGTVVLAVPLLGGPSLSSICTVHPPCKARAHVSFSSGELSPSTFMGSCSSLSPWCWGRGGSTEALHSQALGWAGFLGYVGNSHPGSLPPTLTVTFQERARGDQSSLGSRGAPLLPLSPTLEELRDGGRPSG